MTIVLLILLFVIVVLAIAVLAARFYPGSILETVGLDPQAWTDRHRASDATDMQQLLELENRRRRAAGLGEVTEDELRDQAGH